MTPADWQDCGEGQQGAYGGGYGPGSHRSGRHSRGRHPANGGREVEGQTQQPLGGPGEQREPSTRWVEPGSDRPPK